MQNLITSLVLSAAVLQTFGSPSLKVTRSDPVLVRSVIDADAIQVVSLCRMRLVGITAVKGPRRTLAPPLAREARERLESLVLNRWVRLEWDADRSVARGSSAYVMREDGVFVNAEMVRTGFARVTGRPPLGRLNELLRAEREAQTFRRGIWADAAAGYTRPPRVARE